MNTHNIDYVWIFNGAKSSFPSAVFLEKDIAILWISHRNVTGVLTKYPVNIGLYDWAVESGYFSPKRDDQRTPEFIEKFTCASLEHYHFENGKAI